MVRGNRSSSFGKQKNSIKMPLVDTGDFPWNTLIDTIIEWQPILLRLSARSLK